MKSHILEIRDDWKALEYQEQRIGSASIVIEYQDEGYYFMELVDDYALYHIQTRIPVRCLKINGDIVMVDDPLHWIGMQRLAEASSGRVLVGGLGLGIVVRHLVNNQHVSSIEVIELNEDVIKMVSPLLPDDPRIKVIQGNIFEYMMSKDEYTTVINDIWVKKHRHKGHEKWHPVITTHRDQT